MRAHPIGRYLVRFDADDPVAPPPPFLFVAPAVDPALVVAAERESAYAEGHEAGVAAERLEAEAARGLARTAFDAELAAARAAWVSEEAQRLADRLGEGWAALTADLSHCVEQVLRPFLSVAVRDKAMADLGGTLARLGDDDAMLRIAGPADLLQAIGDAAACGGRVDFEVDANVDVKVVAQSTLIETRIGAWVERLHGLKEHAARG